MKPALSVPRMVGPLGWGLIGLRLFLMMSLFLGCMGFYGLWRLARAHNPWPRLFLAGVAWIAGVRSTVSGELRRKGVFLLVNHVSWIDIPAIAGATGAAFVGHDGLAQMPLLRWLCAMNDTVFVARHDRKSVASQVEQVRTALNETGVLAIFPEGTTSDGTGLLPFKSSLLSALVPVPAGIAVQPVLLAYGPEAPQVAWVGEEHGLDNFLRILARTRPVHLAIRFLPPLSGHALADRKAMAAAARAALLAQLVPA